MAFDFNAHVRNVQKAINEAQQDVPSAQTILQCSGFELAARWGLLKPYMDAWGANFGRPDNAWDRWKDVYPDSEFF